MIDAGWRVEVAGMGVRDGLAEGVGVRRVAVGCCVLVGAGKVAVIVTELFKVEVSVSDGLAIEAVSTLPLFTEVGVRFAKVAVARGCGVNVADAGSNASKKPSALF